MDVYLDKLFKRWKRNDALLSSLFQDFPILHDFAKKTTPQKDVLYVGFQEEATRQEIELQIQIQSLQKAIVYANARLQSPDKIILLNTLPI